jgi:hypothetical protein
MEVTAAQSTNFSGHRLKVKLDPVENDENREEVEEMKMSWQLSPLMLNKLYQGPLF